MKFINIFKRSIRFLLLGIVLVLVLLSTSLSTTLSVAIPAIEYPSSSLSEINLSEDEENIDFIFNQTFTLSSVEEGDSFTSAKLSIDCSNIEPYNNLQFNQSDILISFGGVERPISDLFSSYSLSVNHQTNMRAYVFTGATQFFQDFILTPNTASRIETKYKLSLAKNLIDQDLIDSLTNRGKLYFDEYRLKSDYEIIIYASGLGMDWELTKKTSGFAHTFPAPIILDASDWHHSIDTVTNTLKIHQPIAFSDEHGLMQVSVIASNKNTGVSYGNHIIDLSATKPLTYELSDGYSLPIDNFVSSNVGTSSLNKLAIPKGVAAEDVALDFTTTNLWGQTAIGTYSSSGVSLPPELPNSDPEDSHRDNININITGDSNSNNANGNIINSKAGASTGDLFPNYTLAILIGLLLALIAVCYRKKLS